MPGYIKAVQTIADDQTEVATKTQQLLDSEEIDVGEITKFEVTTFGANKFLITILYDSLRELRSLLKSFGLKAVAPSKRLNFKRTLVATMGFVSSLAEKSKDVGNNITAKLGFALVFKPKLSTKLNTKIGFKTIAFSWKVPIINKSLAKTAGLKLAWAASYNGVPIAPLV
jgi:hypothetical protein